MKYEGHSKKFYATCFSKEKLYKTGDTRCHSRRLRQKMFVNKVCICTPYFSSFLVFFAEKNVGQNFFVTYIGLHIFFCNLNKS
jgi:hypothetical protein